MLRTGRKKAASKGIMMKSAFRFASLLVAGAVVGFGAFHSQPAAAQKPLKVYVSAGFDGNTWMNASLNLIKAMAKTPEFSGKVQIEIQSARGDAQVQLQQINAMVQAGADAILVWPMSPTALNRSIRQACQRGVTIVTWDADVSEPCTYHVGIDQSKAGSGPAEWLAKTLDGKGNIAFLGGIPGTRADTLRSDAAKAVFAKHPDMKVVAQAYSMYNPATARQKLAEIVAARGWDGIDGVFTQTGCDEFAKLEVEAGRTSFKPCAGNGTNDERLIMLPKGTTEGALGAPGISMGSPPWAAAEALKIALKVHAGEKPGKNEEIPLPLVSNDNMVLCRKADLSELKARDWACTAVPRSVAPGNFFIDVWSKEIPELDLHSALTGDLPQNP